MSNTRYHSCVPFNFLKKPRSLQFYLLDDTFYKVYKSVRHRCWSCGHDATFQPPAGFLCMRCAQRGSSASIVFLYTEIHASELDMADRWVGWPTVFDPSREAIALDLKWRGWEFKRFNDMVAEVKRRREALQGHQPPSVAENEETTESSGQLAVLGGNASSSR